MDARKLESGLAYFTLGVLIVYAPVETIKSLPYGLLSAGYLIDLIAMALMLAGALHSLRYRPNPSPALLCAAYAWSSANGWRATWWRYNELARGGSLDNGNAELWAVGVVTGLALVCFALSLLLVVRAAPDKQRIS